MLPLTLQTKLIVAGILAGLVALLALTVGVGATYLLMRRPAPKAETPAAEIRNADGSVTGERLPDAHPGPPTVMLPKGAVETRRDTFKIRRPEATPPPTGSPAGTPSTCPDMEVQLSTARLPDGSSRVTAKSPGGLIYDFRDVPIALVNQDYARKNAVGLAYDTRRRQTIFYEHDFARLRTGVDVFREPDLTGRQRPGVGARLAYTF